VLLHSPDALRARTWKYQMPSALAVAVVAVPVSATVSGSVVAVWSNVYEYALTGAVSAGPDHENVALRLGYQRVALAPVLSCVVDDTVGSPGAVESTSSR
jgi:hypothetical protein